MHIKRHSMKELPETEDAIAQWCRDMFVAKVQNIKVSFSNYLVCEN